MSTLSELRGKVYLALIRHYGRGELILPEEIYPKLKKSYPIAEINSHLNTAVREIVKKTGALRQKITKDLTAPTHYFTDELAPIYEIDEIVWDDSTLSRPRPLTPITQREADKKEPDWETKTPSGSPTHYIYLSEQTTEGEPATKRLKVFPRPKYDGTVSAYGKGLDTPMTKEDMNCSLEGWDDAIVALVLFKLTLAAHFWSTYQLLLSEIRKESAHRRRDGAKESNWDI